MSRRAWAAAMIALAPAFCTAAAAANDMAAAPPNSAPAEVPANAANSMGLLLLAVVVNGRDTGKIGEFVERDGVLLARPAELEVLGFRVPQAAANPNGLVSLQDLPGLQYRLDRTAQSLFVTAANAALLPALLRAGDTAGSPIAVQSGIGATLNYDLVATRAASQTSLSGQFDLRAFSHWGVASTGLLVYPQGTEQSPNGAYQAVRLDSTWTLSHPD